MKKQMTAVVVAAALLLGNAATIQARNVKTQVISYDKTKLLDKCVEVGIEGEYIAEAEAALNRMNAIRQEACQEGLPNPNNPSVALTMEDYRPLQWSSDLEYMARIRAAEASIVMNHVRTSGAGWNEISSPNPIFSNSEDLAWNFSKTMLHGINQWYEEKGDWKIQNTSAVTGHYTSMINPQNTHVGVGTFYSSDGCFPNTTCARFAGGTGYPTSYMPAVKDAIQKLQIQTNLLQEASMKFDYKISGFAGSSVVEGDKIQYSLRFSTSYQGSKASVIMFDKQTWTSSNPAVASVDSTGVVTAKKAGTAKLTAAANGYTATTTVTVEKNTNAPSNPVDISSTPSSTPNTVTTNANGTPAMKKTKITTVKAGKKKITVGWKKVLKNVTGYQIRYATNKKFAKKKGKTIKGYNKTKVTLKKLKPKKKYYIQVRTYCTYQGKKYYSAWSAVKSKKTK